MTCQNCGSKLSCGCQKRIATDGREVCSSCVANYESMLNAKKLSVEQEQALKLAAMRAAIENNK
jgi:hypothetical protein